MALSQGMFKVARIHGTQRGGSCQSVAVSRSYMQLKATFLMSSNLLKAKVASSCVVVQCRHSQLQCGFMWEHDELKLQLLLSASIPVPSVRYACEL